MAISDNYAPTKDLGDGVTTDFSFTWDAIESDSVEVYFEDVATGVQTLQTTGFTLTLSNPGGTVAFSAAPTSANYVIIARNVDKTQSSAYKTAQGFQGDVIENSFDKLTAITQDLADSVDRSLRIPLGSAQTIDLPAVVANRGLIWNAAGDNLTNTSFDLSTVGSEIDALEDAISAATAGSGVLVSSNDTTVGFLNGKLVAGNAITFTENNDGNNETLTVAVTDGAIDTAEIADDAVTTAKIEDDAVTAAKLADTSVSAGSYTKANITVDAQGRLTAASNGGESGRVLLATTTISAPVAEVEFTSATSGVLDGTYDYYIVEFIGVTPATDLTRLRMTVSDDGGSTYESASYAYNVNSDDSNAQTSENNSTSATFISLTGEAAAASQTIGSGTNEGFVNATIHIKGFDLAAGFKSVYWEMAFVNADAHISRVSGSGAWKGAASVLNGVKFAFSSGNFESGKIKIYGIS